MVVVRSAGTAPADTINPAVVAVMAEVGIDLHAEGARPKRLDDAAVRASDVVITMGCGDECPFYPGRRYEYWNLPDRAGKGVDAVRPIRDEIDRRVRALLAELAGGRAEEPGGSQSSADQQQAAGSASALTGLASAADAQHSPAAGCITGASANTV